MNIGRSAVGVSGLCHNSNEYTFCFIEELIWKYVSLTKGTRFKDQALVMKASSVLVRTETGHSQGIIWKMLCWKFLWIGLRFACLFITEFDWNLKIIFIAKALSQKYQK